MVLLLRRQIQYLQRTNHRLCICPGGFCKDRCRRKALCRIGSDIHIRKERTVSAQSLHKAHILKIKKRQDVLDLLVHPLITLCITDCRTDTHTGRRTVCNRAACSHRLPDGMPDTLRSTVPVGGPGRRSPALADRIRRAVRKGIGLRSPVADRMRYAVGL